MRTVIFDLDGTLADTSGDLIAAANAVLCELGHAAVLDMARDKGTAFQGGRALLRLGFVRVGEEAGELAVDAGYARFLEVYAAALDRHTVLYPGVGAAMERLDAGGYALGVCTNKPVALAEELLDRLGMRKPFASVVGADTLSVRKPDPAPYRLAVARAAGALHRSLLIGDTVTDRKTARAAGVPCALVTFGPEGGAMADLAPDALMAGYGELDETVRRLIG